VFIAGDILLGTPMSSTFKGRPDVECFNVIGVSAMTVGNHEFDFGMENFLSI
jgi:2',3'-cyclic-nucleotide 2'-phosphodiesterase (5'-nucleotidase family)